MPGLSLVLYLHIMLFVGMSAVHMYILYEIGLSTLLYETPDIIEYRIVIRFFKFDLKVSVVHIRF